jgi:hypothetical protein
MKSWIVASLTAPYWFDFTTKPLVVGTQNCRPRCVSAFLGPEPAYKPSSCVRVAATL